MRAVVAKSRNGVPKFLKEYADLNSALTKCMRTAYSCIRWVYGPCRNGTGCEACACDVRAPQEVKQPALAGLGSCGCGGSCGVRPCCVGYKGGHMQPVAAVLPGRRGVYYLQRGGGYVLVTTGDAQLPAMVPPGGAAEIAARIYARGGRFQVPNGGVARGTTVVDSVSPAELSRLISLSKGADPRAQSFPRNPRDFTPRGLASTTIEQPIAPRRLNELLRLSRGGAAGPLGGFGALPSTGVPGATLPSGGAASSPGGQPSIAAQAQQGVRTTAQPTTSTALPPPSQTIVAGGTAIVPSYCDALARLSSAEAARPFLLAVSATPPPRFVVLAVTVRGAVANPSATMARMVRLAKEQIDRNDPRATHLSSGSVTAGRVGNVYWLRAGTQASFSATSRVWLQNAMVAAIREATGLTTVPVAAGITATKDTELAAVAVAGALEDFRAALASVLTAGVSLDVTIASGNEAKVGLLQRGVEAMARAGQSTALVQRAQQLAGSAPEDAYRGMDELLTAIRAEIAAIDAGASAAMSRPSIALAAMVAQVPALVRQNVERRLPAIKRDFPDELRQRFVECKYWEAAARVIPEKTTLIQNAANYSATLEARYTQEAVTTAMGALRAAETEVLRLQGEIGISWWDKKGLFGASNKVVVGAGAVAATGLAVAAKRLGWLAALR